MNFTSNEVARITDDFQELANDCYHNGDPDVT